MRELARSAVDAMTENPKATLFCLTTSITLLCWSTYTFASKEDVKAQLEQIKEEVSQINTRLTGVSREIRVSALQTQRRDLIRQIDEIRRLENDGSGTERDRARLPLLVSDLEDVQDEIRVLGAR